MDLIYIILSVFLRLFPAVRNHSSPASSSSRNQRRDLVELAVWLPLFGWVSVLVQQMPDAIWLTRRVRDIRSFDRISLDSLHRKTGWSSNPLGRTKIPPKRDKSPD